jgi:hypothetical protein
VSRALKRLIAVAAVAVASAFHAGPATAQPDQLSNVQGLMAQARTAFDQLDYEGTVKALEYAISAIQARPTDELKKLLPSAYEMRARSQFGLGKLVEARADFVSLLKADPGYALTGQVSPRIVSMFDEVAKATVTTAKLIVTPATADVLLDGSRVSTNGDVFPIAVGDHTVQASRIGYRSSSATFTAAPDVVNEDTITLERVSTVFSFVTSPPGVKVIIDGIEHGETKPGPPPADYAERAARAGMTVAELSGVLIVTDVPIGAHRIQFKKECYVEEPRSQTVDHLDDFIFDPIKLKPATATLSVKSSEGSTAVYLDDTRRGVTPTTIADVCEGEHVVELRSASGRYLKRVEAHTGENLAVAGTLKPAFALVSATGTTALNTDLRLLVERLFDPAQSIMLFAPKQADAAKALADAKLPADWLALDGNKRAIGNNASDISAVMRKDLSTRLTKVFEAQGIASVTVPSAANRNRIVVTLLAQGSGDPDVLDISLDSQDTINTAIARLDRGLSFFRPSIGLQAVDIADIEGPVIVEIDPTGFASKAGVVQGDILLKVNAQPVADASGILNLLAGRRADDTLTLDLKDKAGAAKKVDVKVFMTPRVIGMTDQTLMINRILVDLRARLGAQGDPVEDSVMRLNLAVALARVENWTEARLELQRVKLPDAPGVSNGTVQYLLGICADRLSNRAEAETAWKAAAATTALLTEDGPSVKELADIRLAELQRRPVR